MFDHLIGNPSIKKVLKNLLASEKKAPVYLFSGTYGVGKFAFAKSFAHHIVQGHREDMSILTPEGKAKLHTIETIRELIQEAQLPPYAAKARVFILDEADKMQQASANALLKTLEEAPQHNMFVLVSSNPSHILPTIKSRAMQLRFLPIDQEEIALYLQNQHKLTPEKARFIAASSEGSLANALKELENGEFHDLLLTILSQMPHTFPASQEKVEKISSFFAEEGVDHERAKRLFSLTLAYFKTSKIPLHDLCLDLAKLESSLLAAVTSYVKPGTYLLSYFLELQKLLFSKRY